MPSPQRALIVDLNPVICDIFEAVLGHWNIACSTANDDTAAIEHIKQSLDSQQGFDLIVAKQAVSSAGLTVEAIHACYEPSNSTKPQVVQIARESRSNSYEPSVSPAIKSPILISALLDELAALQITPKASTSDKRLIRSALLSRAENYPWLENPPAILLVEDNPINQALTKDMFKTFSTSLDVAENGLEGVKKVAITHYDIVLMDVQMPKMDGNEATREIRKQFSKFDLPIVGVSASSFAHDIRNAYEAGMNSFMSKPVHIENLVYMVLQYWGVAAVSSDKSTEPAPEPSGESTSENTELDVINQLKNQEGLNSKYLIDIIGEDGYLTVISVFAKHTRDIIIDAKAHHQEWSVKEKHAFVHRIKGSAANIGHLELITMAGKYEQEVNEEQELDPLIEKVDDLLNLLEKKLLPLSS